MAVCLPGTWFGLTSAPPACVQIWICPFCYTRNHFPAHYAGISEQSLPAELFPSYTTLE